ncbi:MAG: DUF5652 family protein [Patescibacteria group bacterium]|jgi:hypothetical protein|nr:hypothetical protein [Candidatus Magasanikbacteria bacterium]HQL52797.1 DUF5652 family protein [Candidatus Magasanikbacteria bacterium]
MNNFFMFAGWGMFFFFLLIIWVIIWKGIALWLAARNNHKIWFIIILLINTISILEIIYIFAVAMKKPNAKKTLSEEIKFGEEEKTIE